MNHSRTTIPLCALGALLLGCQPADEGTAGGLDSNVVVQDTSQLDEGELDSGAEPACFPPCNYAKICTAGACESRACEQDSTCNPPAGRPAGDPTWYCYRGHCAGYQCSAASDCGEGQDCNTFTSLCYDLPTGCVLDAHCIDTDDCTVDTCDKDTGECVYKTAPGCCATAADCKGLSKCTKVSCAAGKCVYDTVDGCCEADAECYDGKICTSDHCKAGKCLFEAVAGCCTGSGACDDGDDASADLCHQGKCLHQWPGVAKTCTDSAKCAGGTCLKGSCHAGQCGYDKLDGAGCCDSDAVCTVTKACTIGQCLARVCKSVPETPTGTHVAYGFDDAKLSGWQVVKGNAAAFFHLHTGEKVAGAGSLRYGVPGKVLIGPGTGNQGTITSPMITLPAKTPGVQFEVYFDGNPISSVQVFGLQVVAAGKTTEVWEKTKDLGGSTQQQWLTQAVKLDAWAGKKVQLRLYFDVKFATNKEDKVGLLIDEFAVVGACP